MNRMLFYIISIGIPVILYISLPKILRVNKDWRWLLFVACMVFALSWYLPSPIIDGEQTEFVTHFVGGGIFTGLLWLYIKLVKKWQAVWWLEAASLFALVSTLGALNELFELVLFKLGGMPHGITDTSYDIVANTLGALCFFVMYSIFWSKAGYDSPRD